MPESDHSYYRYRGPLPYQDRDIDRQMFFGREAEARKLLSLVLSERLTVLFAKSGLGKTSLINAGLMEELRKKRYFPIRVRFNTEKTGLTESVLLDVEEKASSTNVKVRSSKRAGRENLWKYFYHTSFQVKGKPVIPVLILDQFEEVFNLYTQSQYEDFFDQLSSIVRNIPPYSILTQTEKSEIDANSKLNLKVLIGIREDYLAELENLAKKIPQILRNRFRLGPFSVKNAKMAIENPASLEGNFRSSSYTYSESAVKKILEYLCNNDSENIHDKDADIEPAQLQLICQSIENKIIEEKRKPDCIIYPEDIGGRAGLDSIIKNYFNREIQKIRSFKERMEVRRLFAKGLLTERNNRIGLAKETIINTFRVAESSLNRLTDARLLRAETRRKVVYYEIPHDTLVAPIRHLARERKMLFIPVLSFIALAFCLFLYTFANKAYSLYGYVQMQRIGDTKYIFAEETGVYSSSGSNRNKLVIDIRKEYYGKFIKYALRAKRSEEILEEYGKLISLPQFNDKTETIFNLTRAFIPMENQEVNHGLLIATADFLSSHPQNKDPFFIFQIAKELYDIGQNEKARLLFRLAIKFRDNFNKEYFIADIYYYLGDILGGNGNCREALQYMEKANRLKPSAFQYSEIVQSNCQKDKNVNSHFNYMESRGKDAASNENVNFNIELAIQYMERNKLKAAEIELKKALEDNAFAASANYHLGLLKMKENKTEEAYAYFSLALKLSPDSEKFQSARAYAILELKDCEKALPEFESLFDRNPSNADYAYHIGFCNHLRGNLKQARLFYTKALEIDSKNSLYRYKLGMLFLDLEETDKALEAFEQAANDPVFYEPLYELAKIYQNKENYEKAIEYYEKAYTLHPKLFLQFSIGETHRLYARKLSAQKEYLRAAGHYSKALEYNVYDQKTLNELGYLYLKGLGVEKNYQSAFELFLRSAEFGNAFGQYYLGLMYYEGLGVPVNYRAALEWWTKSAEHGNTEAQYRAGLMYLEGKNIAPDRAKALYFLKMAAEKNHPQAEALLKSTPKF